MSRRRMTGRRVATCETRSTICEQRATSKQQARHGQQVAPKPQDRQEQRGRHRQQAVPRQQTIREQQVIRPLTGQDFVNQHSTNQHSAQDFTSRRAPVLALTVAALTAALMVTLIGWTPAIPAQAVPVIETIEEVGTIPLDASAVNCDSLLLVDDRYLYVGNEGAGDLRGGSIFIVDVTTGTVIERMWFDDHAWPANSILIDLYQSDTGYIYASFPNVGHLVVLDPTKPVGKKEIRDIDLRALTGDTEVYNQSLAISGDTVFVGDDDGGAGVIQMSLDGSSARTHPLTEDARPYVPTNQLPLYEQATAQSLTVSPDGASLYVGVHLQIMGTDGRGLFMAYAIGSDGSLTLTYAMLCETQELIQTIIVTPQHVYAPSFILTSMDVEHNVYVFDNTAGTVALSGCIELDNTVQGARLSPDGLVYITTLSETGTNGGFAVLRPTIGSIGEVAYKVNNADERLVGLAFSADGRLIYASNFGGGEDSPDPLITVYALSSALESLEPPIISVPDPNTPPASTLPATGEAGGVLALAAAVILLLSGVLVLLGRRLYMRDARPWSANRQNRQNTSERHAAKRNAGG